uniref:Uncharacterized protein, isoform B n=1 Tax=Drosophila melanogaster TaxID=7227 RepID=A0A0B4K7X9_DROME|nr:uncharacterized protein Dmel_CG13488, isoform B [Drosophila melanogaster]AFH08205.1 uncharacterized protein Dmel_CG13488, isoform B [Drosophila melanogaster]|eukprot:NP_001246452.1 uncharacterized protein Dmel_CG13488, isoform B [Drosophila melanogaster]
MSYQNLLGFLLVLTPSLINTYGDRSRYRLYLQSDYALQTISTQLVSQAIELVDYVVEDLIVLDSQNSILLGYLDRFDAFTAVNANKTEQKLNAFYGVIEDYLDSDTTGDPLRTSSIETQLIALCLQRNGFDRWKRTVQTRTSQLQKLIYRKLRKHLESIDREDRLAVERRWRKILTRGGPRRLEKLREFVKWLGNFRD